jgi:hypothetical protein
MPLQKSPISWPLLGGLATKGSPLSVQPGSHLTLENVVQERADEWRRRNGFTQVAADTLSGFGLVAAMPDGTGVVSHGTAGSRFYLPSLTSNRWRSGAQTGLPVWARTPLASTPERTMLGTATAGTFVLSALNGTSASAPKVSLTDTVGGSTIHEPIAAGYLRIRCAATSTHAVAIAADSSGNLVSFVWNVSTGVLTGPTTIKTGMHTTQPYLDAHYYDGSTITIVCRESGNQIRFIEYNPSTGALATDALLAVNADNCVSLLMDPDASGTRFVGVSNATPSTRVLRVTSAGSVSTNDEADGVAATQIAGCAYTAGAEWTIVYQTSAALKRNYKQSGAVGTAALLSVSLALGGTDITIDSQAWRDVGLAEMRFVVGLHSTTSGDEQHSWVEAEVTQTSTAVKISSRFVPLGAAPSSGLNASLYQAQRLGTGSFRVGMLRASRFSLDAATVMRSFAADAWTSTTLTGTNMNSVNIGRPAMIPGAAVFPGGETRLSIAASPTSVSGPSLGPIGLHAAPRKLSLASGTGGSMTSSVIYGYVAYLELTDTVGNVWRSPPSIPALVTMGASDNRVTVTFTNWTVETEIGQYRLVIARTSGNGSVYRRIASYDINYLVSTQAHVDDASDSSIVTGDILYTTGELPTAITPPASHVAAYGDRLWLVNRDFPTELMFSKNIRPGVQPEFCDEFTLDLDDDKGDITGIAPMDDKLVVFKRNAIYFVQGGENLGNNGQGQFPIVTRVDADLGAIVGSPLVSCGPEIYFVADRGIYSIDRAANVAWAGEAIDQYLHQPLIQTPETVTDGVFVSEANEVRFTTTTYVLVYDRDAKIWSRWTGLSGMTRALVIGGRMVMFRGSDGTVWREGDHTQRFDEGELGPQAVIGTIRSAWIRAAGTFGRFRLYRAHVLGTRTAGGANISPSLTVYLDNSDTAVQTFSPPSAISGGTSVVRAVAYPRTQKCTAFSLQLTLPSGDLTYRLDQWGATVGIQPVAQKQPAAQRWV